MDFANTYAAIIKSEKQEDGSLLVYGKATDDSLDIDNQICDDLWLSSAMPQWFKTGGNVREQHSSIAAGVAKEYEAKEDGHYISVLVVDPVSVKKVETGVLKGFSIGIKSPRVIRDTKAANGRIVDGQIVEISLVDRPANPNAKLVLAKSIEGESSLVQVEDLIENTEEIKMDKSALVKTIIEIRDRSVTLNKFDQAAYETARNAIAQLIIIEANETITDGSDERDDIETLLDALKHLFRWYEEEAEAGEVPGAPVAELLELSAIAKDGCECDCDSCGEDKGCDSKMCKCDSMKSADADAVEETLLEEIKTEETEVAPTDEVVPAEVPAIEAVEEIQDDILNDKAVSAILEKAVKSATESVRAEIDLLKTAVKASEEKSVSLESELVLAKSAAASGGPKRTGAVSVTKDNELLLKAAEYRAKAVATSDPILQKGFRALADEYTAKASKPSKD